MNTCICGSIAVLKGRRMDPDGLFTVDGEKLRQRRLALHWTTRELAGYAKTGHDAISEIEKGKRRPRKALLERIAAALGVEPKELLRDE